MTYEFLTTVTPGAVYLYVLMLLSLGLERWVGFCKRFTLLFWAAAFAVLVVSALVVTKFHDVASSYGENISSLRPEERYAEDLSAHEARVEADRANFVEQARWVFYLLCAGIVVLTLGVSAWIGRRASASERYVPTSIAFIIMMLVYLAVALPYVDCQNARTVGGTFLFDLHCP